jgi:hypothetical protein
MNDIDLVCEYIAILVIVVGLFKAALRARDWYWGQ